MMTRNTYLWLGFLQLVLALLIPYPQACFWLTLSGGYFIVVGFAQKRS